MDTESVSISLIKSMTLDFVNIGYQIKSKKSTKTILKDVCGKFETGRLSAILGPSGAGKSSLLNILSGFKCNGVQGSIQINGTERNITEFRKMCTYISQRFPMLDNLTVMETLKVSADLKLGSSVSPKAKVAILKDIISLMNMDACTDTMVSKLSGGERKRLSIGVELVTNPPIMFFDEPTSGLDSVASYQILEYLQRLAQDGRIVICVIHQPSSRILNLFDDALVVAEGRSLYCGPLQQMVPFFEHCGFSCPNYYNPADFVLEVASKDRGSDLSALIQTNNERFHAQISTNDKGSNPDYHDSFSQSLNQVDKSSEKKRQYPVGGWAQFAVLTKRSFRSMWRDLLTVQLRVIVHTLVGFLLGVVFYDIGNEASRVLSNASLFFFCVMFIFFGNALPALLTCPLETSVFIREHLNGWYSITAYYFAKIVSDFPLLFVCPTLLSFLAYYMTGQPADSGRFVMFWGVGLLTALMGQAIGLVFGSAFKMQTGIFLLPGLCIPILLFSGFFVRRQELSSYLRPLADVSFFRYSLEGYVQSIYGYGRANLTCSTDFCYFKSVNKFLREMDMEGDLYGIDILAMLLTIVVLNSLFYLSLRIGVKRAQ